MYHNYWVLSKQKYKYILNQTSYRHDRQIAKYNIHYLY